MKKIVLSKKFLVVLLFLLFSISGIVYLHDNSFSVVKRVMQSSKKVKSGINQNSIIVDTNYNKSATSLVHQILGDGLTATSISKSGTVYSFSNGIHDVGIDSGIVLDTSGKVSSNNYDSDLKKLMEYSYGGDTSSVEFTMTATGNLLNFNYVFLSTEFDQPVKYNDIFGLFVSVNGGAYENIATITRENGKKVPVNISNLKAGLSGNELVGKPISMKNYSLFTAKNINIGSGTNGVSNVFNAQKEVQVGDVVKVKFVIADVSDKKYDSYVMIESSSLSFEKPIAKVNYKQEMLTNLESRVTYKIVEGDSVYEITSGADGKLPLVGADNEGCSYDFIGKKIQVIKKGYGNIPDSESQEVVVDDRPIAPESVVLYTGTSASFYNKDIEITKNSIKILAKEGQQYSIDGENYQDALENGYVVFDHLDAISSCHLFTRYAATDEAFASFASPSVLVELKDTTEDLVKIHNYRGVYDGKYHSAYVEGDVTVQYSDTLDGVYTDDVLEYKDAGVYKVYYCASRDGYYSTYGELEVVITKKEVVPKIKLPSLTYSYSGEEIVPSIELYDGDEIISTYEYSVTYSNNIFVGTATVHVSNNLGGNYIIKDNSTSFTIVKKELGDLRVVLDDEQFIYDGGEKRPTFTLYDGDEVISSDKYIVEYSNNINASTIENPAIITIKSCEESNYEFSVTYPFMIDKLKIEVSATVPDTSVVYSGGEQRPAVLVQDVLGNVLLDNEYDISYFDNVNVGTAKINIKGKDISNYEFACDTTFMITKRTIKKPIISLNKSKYIYDGTEKRPEVFVKDGDFLLPSSQYDVFYDHNVSVGEGTVRVKSREESNYLFEGVASFQILPREISPKVVLEGDIFEYSGEEIRTDVLVYDFDVLIDANEYDVTYEDNIEVGTAKVIIKNKDTSNYKFVVSKNFEIKKVGTISKISSFPNVGNMSIVSEGHDLGDKIPLTQEEKDLRARGSDIFVYIKVVDISDTILVDEKENINRLLRENESIGMYLDVSLFKRQDGVEEKQITRTNGKVKIGMQIPDDLICSNPNVRRVYSIIRVHEGDVAVLDVDIDQNFLTFETDLFSTYALIYQDEEIPPTVDSVSNVSQVSNPNTFDSTFFYIVLSIISGAILFIGGLHIFRKK